jgi:two-component system, cell cycle response regulator DivK
MGGGSTGSAVLDGVAVLVVEDHPESGRMIAAMLEAAGAVVKVVGSAEDAVDVVDVFRPRILVVDLVLPGVSGAALVRSLKANMKTSKIVCVAVTVQTGYDDERAAMDAGCVEYVRKPIDTDTFAAVLAGHLEKAR